MSKTTSAVVLIGTDITTAIVYIQNHATPMAAFKNAPGCAGTHSHVFEKRGRNLIKSPDGQNQTDDNR